MWSFSELQTRVDVSNIIPPNALRLYHIVKGRWFWCCFDKSPYSYIQGPWLTSLKTIWLHCTFAVLGMQ